MILSQEMQWERLRKSIQLKNNSPSWLTQILELSFAKLRDLPETTQVKGKGHLVRPSFESKKVTESYLQYLTDQVRMKSRGDAWNIVLESRIKALRPHINETTTNILLYSYCGDFGIIIIDPTNGHIIHWEASCEGKYLVGPVSNAEK